MSRTQQLTAWLERKSDWISPIVVKEVRQVVRGREFIYSFGACLVAGLGVAFFGAAEALTGSGTSGSWTFGALMACLTLLGLAVVPLGAFSALRVERMEQTLELITLTALTPRRVIIGKLLAQGVKLATLFAAMAPFVAMSFLLGGIDFATILLALALLFMWSLWMCSACLFLSSLLTSRAVLALVFGGTAIVLFLVFGVGRMFFYVASRGAMGVGPFGGGLFGTEFWWAMAIMTSFWIASLANLVLLAENRLSLATEDRVTPLRVGFLAQFLLLAAWILSFIGAATGARSNAVTALGVFGGLHLALVAMFVVTEDLVVPRPVQLRARTSAPWRPLLALLRPGGGNGAAYVLVQMILFVAVGALLRPAAMQLRWLVAICGYICFFTGVPVFAFRYWKPERRAALRLRVALLLTLPLSMLLPDLLHYVLWRPEVLSLNYSARHLANPIRTLANWHIVEAHQWTALPFALGLGGLVAYAALIYIGTTVNAVAAPSDPHGSSLEAGEPDRANVLY